jgi:hypothetical protein
VNLSVEANENNPVPSGITLVPFQLVIWYGNFGPVGNVSLSIRDDGDVTILVYLEEVSFVCVGLTSASIGARKDSRAKSLSRGEIEGPTWRAERSIPVPAFRVA